MTNSRKLVNSNHEIFYYIHINSLVRTKFNFTNFSVDNFYFILFLKVYGRVLIYLFIYLFLFQNKLFSKFRN